jgi:hypothetical protein
MDKQTKSLHQEGEEEMYRKPPVWLVFTLLLLFALTLPPRPLNAQEGTISLEQAIQTAKELFPETKVYSDFSSEFNSSPMRSTWGLRWEASADEQGNLFVEVDAHSGEIISFNQWKPEPDSNAPTSMTLSQAQGLASQWLQKLVPQKSSRLRLVSGNDVIPLNGYGNASYNFRWERVENGIPVVGEGAYMEINGRTRNIISYHLNWLETPMVDTGKAIPREQAFGVFQEQQMLKLQYFMPWEVRPLAADGNKEKLRLVYRIDHPSNGTIDALTGKPLILKEGQWKEEMANYAMMGGMGESKRAADLTPQEISELEKNSQILSRDQAAARVKQWVDIPSQATLTSANLGRDWGNPETRVWNLNWNLNATDSSTPPFELWARVDAMSGRLYSFHLYGGEDSVPPKLDRNAAQPWGKYDESNNYRTYSRQQNCSRRHIFGQPRQGVIGRGNQVNTFLNSGIYRFGHQDQKYSQDQYAPFYPAYFAKPARQDSQGGCQEVDFHVPFRPQNLPYPVHSRGKAFPQTTPFHGQSLPLQFHRLHNFFLKLAHDFPFFLGLMVITQQVKHPMSYQEAQFPMQTVTVFLTLNSRLFQGYHDIPQHIYLAPEIILGFIISQFVHGKGEHVRRPVLPTINKIQLLNVVVVNQKNGNFSVAGEFGHLGNVVDHA